MISENFSQQEERQLPIGKKMRRNPVVVEG